MVFPTRLTGSQALHFTWLPISFKKTDSGSRESICRSCFPFLEDAEDMNHSKNDLYVSSFIVFPFWPKNCIFANMCKPSSIKHWNLRSFRIATVTFLPCANTKTTWSAMILRSPRILRPKTRVERCLAWDNAFTCDLCFLACNIFGVFG